MTYQDIIYQIDDKGIAKITLNRPSVLNALSPNLVAELKSAVQDVANNDSVKLLIVRGAGKAFSAGVDLDVVNNNIQSGQFVDNKIMEDGKAFIDTIQNMPKVAIVMVNGFCFTGALEFVLAFDLIYVAEDAKLGDTHTKWGIAPKWGMSQRLPQLVGVLKAREMSYTAKTILGVEAEKIGLANKAFPKEELESRVYEVAHKILDNSQEGVGVMKHLHQYGMTTNIKDALDYEYQSKFEINDREEFLRKFKENKGK